MKKIYNAKDITFDVLSKWTKEEWEQFGNSFKDPNIEVDKNIFYWVNHSTGFWYAYITDGAGNKILQWNKHRYYWEKTYGYRNREIAFKTSDGTYVVCGNKTTKESYGDFIEAWYFGYESYDEDRYSSNKGGETNV